MSALINAMRVLTDPAECGAVCISLPQDVEGEAYDYPVSFFKKRVHRLARRLPEAEALEEAACVIRAMDRAGALFRTLVELLGCREAIAAEGP